MAQKHDGVYQLDDKGNRIKNKDGSFRKKAGRPHGAVSNNFREKNTARYMREMYRTFQKYGQKAMEEVAQNNPDKFLQLFAQIVPKQQQIETNDVTEGRKEFTTVELANAVAGILAKGAEEATGGDSSGVPADMDTDTGASDGGVLH